MDEPRAIAAADLKTGLQAEFERDVTAEDVIAFAGLSRDWNPLHSDEAYARQTNYGGRIVHGAFQVALASAMAGMYLPGREVLVGAFQCRFPAPLRYPSRVRVHGEITAWLPQPASGNLRVRIVELGSLTLTAEVQVSFTLHERRVGPAPQPAASIQREERRPAVLITGAGGGLGQNLVVRLCDSYQVLGMVRSASALPQAASHPGAEWVVADLNGTGWEAALERQLAGRRLYGLVHAAWPGGPLGGLLETEPDAVSAQVEFGGATTVRLAKFLRSQGGESARFVILGTTAATIKPVANMAAYSLGKATLEHAVRLLAPELARSNITINLVAPAFLPIGMNAAKTSRAILAETAKVPLGRLCSPDDVAGAVEYLLSERAAFITGQILPLTGGQL